MMRASARATASRAEKRRLQRARRPHFGRSQSGPSTVTTVPEHRAESGQEKSVTHTVEVENVGLAKGQSVHD